MQLEATRDPIRYRLKTGEEVILRPGFPVDIPDPAAAQLLKKAPGKVRVAEPTCIEPAVSNARPIFWESADGILGPATPEFLAKSGGQFWLVVTHAGTIRWINADRLRSKKDFERQVPLKEIELVPFLGKEA